MPEFDYRGYRVRTLFDKTWQIRMWPPLKPKRLMEHVTASHAEGEAACRLRATALIDKVLSSSQNLRVAETGAGGLSETSGPSQTES